MTRQDAITEIKSWTPILLMSDQCTEKTAKSQEMAILALSENGWIPCSVKKNPDKSMYCHVTVIDDDGDYIVENDDWNAESESWDEFSEDEIIAWMPEIQPYQPKEDES